MMAYWHYGRLRNMPEAVQMSQVNSMAGSFGASPSRINVSTPSDVAETGRRLHRYSSYERGDLDRRDEKSSGF